MNNMPTDNYLKKELYELIKTDERIFDFIQESSLDGLWYWDLENPENEWMNPKFWSVLGYNPDEMPHKSSAWQNIINQDDFKIAIENFTEHCENPNHPYDQIVRYTHKNGSIVWIHCRGMAIRDKNGIPIRMLGVHHDISEIIKKEQEFVQTKNRLEKKEELYRTTFEDAAVGIAHVDLNGCFINVNNKYCNITGYSKEELYKMNISDITYPEDLLIEQEYIDQVLSNKVADYTFEKRLIHKDGHTIWIILFSNVIRDENNQIRFAVATISDITEQKTLKDEIIKAKKKAEQSNKLKTAFLQNMSHEIRTPLNSIIGFSEMITSPKITDEKRQLCTDIIVKSGFQLLTIVNDILTISAIDTGQEELNKENICINSLILDIEAVFKQQLEGKKVKIKAIKPLPNADAEILTDKTKLTQILTNFLSNAIKFTPVGEIEFGYTLNNAELEFFVKDNGIGIHKSKHGIIFERFVQADESIVVDYGGTGLGLSICKGFAEMLGGNITLESDKGKGATFYFTIPYKPVQGKNTSTAKNFPENLFRNENYTILVAEDVEANYLYIEVLFKDGIEGSYNLIHAKNGKEAVEICTANKNIDLVLMDIKMPIMNGHEATGKIKKTSPNLPIIAQTAYSTESDKQLALKHGCDDFISKPLDKEKLFKLMTKYLNVK